MLISLRVIILPVSKDPTSSSYQPFLLTFTLEVNLAGNARAYHAGTHPGYEETAWEGLQQSIDVIAKKGIKVAINGGALNPEGLARKVNDLVSCLLSVGPSRQT
jgi:hypothetical protein